jgi:hypothetical protein
MVQRSIKRQIKPHLFRQRDQRDNPASGPEHAPQPFEGFPFTRVDFIPADLSVVALVPCRRKSQFMSIK